MYFTSEFHYGGRYDSGAIIGSFVQHVGSPVNYVVFYITYLVHYMTNKSYIESSIDGVSHKQAVMFICITYIQIRYHNCK